MKQNGTIHRIGKAWYGRWREEVLKDGKVVSVQRNRKLVDYSDRYRTESDVRPLLDEQIQPLRTGKVKIKSTMLIHEFVDSEYLPYAKEELKASTAYGYEKLWKMLSPRLQKRSLREFRTVDAANLLRDLSGKGWGRRSLQHAKSFLSGVFKYAKSVGAFDGENPVRDSLIPRKAAAPEETHATTPEEVLQMLTALEGNLQARAAVGLMFFAGLRPGEARGARWEDLDKNRLIVRQSVWRKHVTAPKTESSIKPVPIIEPLRSILGELRELEGNPSTGPILKGERMGKPLNLNNLARRVVIPAFKKAGIPWHGWYSLRRGIGTLVTDVAKDPLAAKGLLRHANLSTTTAHYVKDVPESTQRGMMYVEQLFQRCSNEARA